MAAEGFDFIKEGVRKNQSFPRKELVFLHDAPENEDHLQKLIELYRNEYGDEAYAQNLREDAEVRARRENEEIPLLQLIGEKGQPPPTPTPLPPTPTPLRLPTGQRSVSSHDSVLVPPDSPFDSLNPDSGPSTAPSANHADKHPDKKEPTSGSAPVYGAVVSKSKKTRQPTSGHRKMTDSQLLNKADFSSLIRGTPLSVHAGLFRRKRYPRSRTHPSKGTTTGPY